MTTREREMMIRLDHERELRERYEAAHAEIHKHEAEALDLARADVNRRLDGMNEMRSQIERERNTYMSRELYDREHTALRDSADARLKVLENSNANLQGKMWMMGAAITFIVSLLSIALRFLRF